MKGFRIIPIICLVLILFSCNNKENNLSGDLVTIPKSAENPSDKMPVIKFDKTKADLGKVKQGEVLPCSFSFTNVGNAPLIITGVDKSCGCTSSEFPQHPIEPGQKGVIKIRYDSQGHQGIVNKSVTVNSNTIPSQTILSFKAEVRR